MTLPLRELLERERVGVLATLSARRQGWPFASVAPYALTHSGEPLFLMSDLAEHTRNLKRDPRASLLVQDSTAADDPQAGSRVTLLGTVEPFQDGSARERFLSRHPEAAEQLTMADFRFNVLRVVEARYIGGFGDMGWLSSEKLEAALRS